MAVQVTRLISGIDSVGGTSFVTGAIEPAPNVLHLLSVTTRTNITADPTIPTATGNGLTWEQVATALFDTTSASRKRITVLRAMGPTPTAGPVTIDFAGQTQTDILCAIEAATGVVRTGVNGQDAIRQSVTFVDETAPGVPIVWTMTLAALGQTLNAAYGAVGMGDATCTFSPGPEFTTITDIATAAALRHSTEWLIAGRTTVDFTQGGLAQQLGGIALELVGQGDPLYVEEESLWCQTISR